jgi:serine/threonine protein kinase
MEVLGHIAYEKLEEIGVGQGKMSRVWKAQDKHLGGVCAIKEIPKEKLRKQGVKDLFQEAKVMFAAEHPQNVVPIRYACDCPNLDTISICMPLYRRGSLLDRTTTGPVPIRELLRIAHGALNGLKKIHNAGFIHFDLKPSNILLNDRSEPMVADFGQTRRRESDGTAELPAMYPKGLPPEFYTGSTGSVYTDIFHFGLLLYRAANGEPFFDQQFPPTPSDLQQRTLEGSFPDTARFMPHVPKSLRTIIRKAVSVNPTDRYRSVSDLEFALANVTPKNNWETTLHPDGTITWRSRRKDMCDLEVEVTPEGHRRRIDVFTNSGTRRRKPGHQPNGALSPSQAMAALKKVFDELG